MTAKQIFLSFLALFSFFLLSCSDPDLYEDDDDCEGVLVSFSFEKTYNPELLNDLKLTVYNNKKVAGYMTHDIDLSSMVPTFDVKDGELYCSNIKQTSKEDKQDFTTPVTYVLIDNNGKRKTFTVNILPYTGLPVVVLHTRGESKMANKEDWIPTHIHIDGIDEFENYDDSVFVRGRGNSTWLFPKKAFNMKMYNKDPILGMPKHKRWCFLANWRDRTLLRNKVTFHIGQQMDNLAWTPRSQFAEVIFNGEHIGNFQITEHIRVDKNRVNIKEMSSGDVEGKKLTGGYLLELDSYFDEVNKFRSARYELPVNIKNPDEDVLQPEQLNYIETYINELEDLLKNKNYEEAYTHLDMNSFIDFWMVNALVGNPEMETPYSTYCHKDREGKINAGPLWDFDLGTFATEASSFNGRSNVHFSSWWYETLFQDPNFAQKVKERFAEMKPTFLEIPSYIDKESQYLAKSVEMNWKLWPIDVRQLDNNLNGDEEIEDYADAIARMKDMYVARLTMLEDKINQL